MKTKYVALKSGFSPNKKDLPKVISVLKQIEKKQGIITPKIVVTEAESSRSPLHRYFTWDDTKAAEFWREEQARGLIQSISVCFKDDHGKEQTIRAFVNVSPDDSELGDPIAQRGYISIERTRTNAGGYKNQVVQYAYSQLLIWKRKFGAYKEFLVVNDAITRVKV